MKIIDPKLTLVGAGPGDPDLISIKGIKAIEKADVILYDALVNTELLKYAKNSARIYFVGKRKGMCSYAQDDINSMIVSKAYQYGHVVRLKGGDPFIFGRGAEEIDYARSFAVKTFIVPGISSALSVPASIGISMTHRDVSQSFWVITGTTKKGELSNDIKLSAQSNATVAILMGISKLSEIIQVFKNEQKGELPVAIIQNGTMVSEQIGIGTVNTIEQIVREKELGTPAIIVIGEVVKHRVQIDAIIEDVVSQKITA